MSSILESVQWSKPVLSLLTQCNQLNPKLPAIMHIRHTERPTAQLGSPEGISILSTEQGKKAANEMGTRLPNNRKYRFYHTHIERSKETAIEIQKGIDENKTSSEIIGAIPLSSVVNRAKFSKIARRETRQGVSSTGVFSRWVSGHYPPWVRVPSIEFAQQGAAIMMDQLKTADSSMLDVYVSHDVFIAAFLFHWFGVFPIDWVEFLDGFLLQFSEDYLTAFTKYGKMEIPYPYWWNF